eukprot:689055-Hanusia_phi.AAC.1
MGGVLGRAKLALQRWGGQLRKTGGRVVFRFTRGSRVVCLRGTCAHWGNGSTPVPRSENIKYNRGGGVGCQSPCFPDKEGDPLETRVAPVSLGPLTSPYSGSPSPLLLCDSEAYNTSLVLCDVGKSIAKSFDPIQFKFSTADEKKSAIGFSASFKTTWDVEQGHEWES